MAGGSQALSLFAYGSLQLDEVMEAVTGRRFLGRPAVLPAHRRRLLRGRSYPGVQVDAEESTAGVLFDGLDEEAFSFLDRFEGDPYERRFVAVRCQDAMREGVFAYVVRDAFADWMTAEIWDLDRFRARGLPDFLEQCRAFRRDALLDPCGSGSS